MRIIASGNNLPQQKEQLASPPQSLLQRLLSAWEVYLVAGIVVLAGLLRLYRIDSSTLDVDQTILYRMAHDAILHGHLVATSNASSIGNTNPPGAVYLLMIPAALSADPLWGTILVALLSTFSVLLTYLFVRRYYGLLAAVSVALLYAVAHRPVAYARYIWQPNLMPFFVILFIWLLFRGVVERKRGWLAPAIVLAGFIFQLHTTAILLIAPLFVAILLAPGTIRVRDIILSLLALLLVYAPYLIWELANHFNDILELLGSGKAKAVIDTQALSWYRSYIDPYDGARPDPHTLYGSLRWVLIWVAPVMDLLLIGGLLLALLLPLWLLRKQTAAIPEKVSGWWNSLRSSPYACGLLILFTWQIIPFVGYTRHSLPIFRHYVIFTMPGQFILIGLCLALLAHWFQTQGGRWQIGRFLSYALVALLIVSQGVGTLASDLDQARGNFVDLYLNDLYHSDIGSMHTVLNRADALAQKFGINRLYVATDITQNGMGYLSEQLQTPVTTFDSSRCLVLPSISSGPAIMVLGPHSVLSAALLANFAHANLLETSRHKGGPPYQIYLVRPDAAPGVYLDAFPQHLQLLDTNPQTLHLNNESYLVTRWNMQQNLAASYRKTYNYILYANGVQGWQSGATCMFNSIRAEDHLLVAMRSGSASPTSMDLKIQYYQTTPHLLKTGPLTFETGKDDTTPWLYLLTKEGKTMLTVPIG